MHKPFKLGDPVEVKFITQDGSEIWNPATVCVAGENFIGVAFSDGRKKAYSLGRRHIRRPERREAPAND